MTITNMQGLPEAIVRAVSDDRHPYEENRYSVTELLKPTREIVLSRRHSDELTADAADFVPALLGTAFHALMEAQGHGCRTYTEEPVAWKFGDVTVSGVMDLLDLDKFEILDYKTCSASKCMKGQTDDWRKQLLTYAYLFYLNSGKLMDRIRVVAVLKDWSKIKAATNPSYPQSPVWVWSQRVEDSDIDWIDGWLRAKLADIKAAETELPECSCEERWNDGPTYAVYKKPGDARAAKVFRDPSEADAFCTQVGGYVVERPGDDVKCSHYCPVAAICRRKEANG